MGHPVNSHPDHIIYVPRGADSISLGTDVQLMKFFAHAQMRFMFITALAELINHGATPFGGMLDVHVNGVSILDAPTYVNVQDVEFDVAFPTERSRYVPKGALVQIHCVGTGDAEGIMGQPILLVGFDVPAGSDH